MTAASRRGAENIANQPSSGFGQMRNMPSRKHKALNPFLGFFT